MVYVHCVLQYTSLVGALGKMSVPKDKLLL